MCCVQLLVMMSLVVIVYRAGCLDSSSCNFHGDYVPPPLLFINSLCEIQCICTKCVECGFSGAVVVMVLSPKHLWFVAGTELIIE